MRAETSGVVSRMAVEDGQAVAKGAVIAMISDPTLAGGHRGGAGQGRGVASQRGGA